MVIESVSNPLIKKLKKCNDKSGRDKIGLFLIEGTRLVFHAVKSGVKLDYLLCTQQYLSENQEKLDGLSYQLVSESVLKALSDTQHPQGIIAAVQKPDTSLTNLKISDTCFYVFCDEVRDPGNIGTMIRTAQAAGANGIILSQNCVDIFSQKVVRSTMGSIFTFSIYLCEDKIQCLNSLKNQGCEIVGAHLKKSVDLYEHDFADKTVVVIGNEANGITQEVLQMCDTNIIIPMDKMVESLNAAASFGIIAYERFRQMRMRK